MPLYYIALGGAIGSVLRHLAALAITARLGNWLPWGTLLVNVSGSFVIGVAAASLVTPGQDVDNTAVRYFVIAGLCGGYTTFSSFSLYTLQMLQEGLLGRALLHVTLSVVLCVLATAAGYAVLATR